MQQYNKKKYPNTVSVSLHIQNVHFQITGEVHTRSMQIGGRHLTVLEVVVRIAYCYSTCTIGAVFSMYTVNSMHILLMLLVCKVIGDVTMQCLLLHFFFFFNCRQYTVYCAIFGK